MTAYNDIKDRLAEISEEVKAPDIALDRALDLYEEAIKLASQVGDAIEEDASDSAREGVSVAPSADKAGRAEADPARSADESDPDCVSE